MTHLKDQDIHGSFSDLTHWILFLVAVTVHVGELFQNTTSTQSVNVIKKLPL
jgi:hypothetical protein